MDLKIDEVASLLRVSEQTIKKWLSQNKIPAYRINKQYLFSKDEIENWMMENKAKESSLFTQNEKLSLESDEMSKILHNVGRQKFCLFRALHRGTVLHDIAAEDKEEVIRNATKRFANDLALDADVITELLLDRERMMPTALNHGIGVPHTRDFLLKEPYDVVSVVFLDRPVEYGALDGKPVDTLFFIFSCEDKRHLQLLAKIAHLVSDSNAREFLQKQPKKEHLLDFIKEWEEKLVH